MKIDWKAVAKSPGYISMKKAVAEEAQRCAKWKRKPDERYQQSFEFAINRAKHYAHKTGKSFIEILNEWEEKRDYSFISFYSDHNLSKFHSGGRKHWGLRKQLKNIKEDSWYRNDPRRKSKALRRVITAFKSDSTKRKDKKARWPAWKHKSRADRIKYDY